MGGRNTTPNPRNNGSKWSREEHVIAFNLYFQLPFGKLHKGTPQIIELAELLGRTPSSVAMKLSNFARFDTALQQRGVGGLQSGAKLERVIWDEFAADPERLLFESQSLLAQRKNRNVESEIPIETDDLPAEGRERETLVRVRVNQALFRQRIVSGYNTTCCVTGLTVRSLLVASHIVPWSESKEHRLNARNGLCLNALHDKAFDQGLMWIDEHHRIQFATPLKTASQKDQTAQWITSFQGQNLKLTTPLTPDPELLRWHRERVSLREG